MSTINISGRTFTDLAKLEKEIEKEAIAELGKVMRSAIPAIRSRVVNIVSHALRVAPEWTSLVSGELRSHLGITDAGPVLESILRAITDNVTITQKSALDLTVEVLRNGYTEILQVPGISYQSKGGAVPWLDWLLFKGDNVILAGVSINLNRRTRKASRTGSAIMVQRTKTSGNWRMPAEFSGTSSDNWITRALRDVEPLIADIVAEEIIRRAS